VEKNFMLFKCGGISDSAIDGIGMSLAIFFQGCSMGCKGCQNPELQEKTQGNFIDIDFIEEHLKKYPGFYKSMVFVGGEPLEQSETLLYLLCLAKEFKLNTILYTGWLFKNIPEAIRRSCDIIIDGNYREDLKTGGFPASRNQWIYIRGKLVKMNNDYSRSLTEIFNANKT